MCDVFHFLYVGQDTTDFSVGNVVASVLARTPHKPSFRVSTMPGGFVGGPRGFGPFLNSESSEEDSRVSVKILHDCSMLKYTDPQAQKDTKLPGSHSGVTLASASARPR